MKVMEESLYRNLGDFLRGIFGEKVYKVGLYGGFTCPVRDGTLDSRGCTYCDPRSSRPLSYREGMTLEEQLRQGCSYIARRHSARLFMAYFQDNTATWGDPGRLRDLCTRALEWPGVVGLALCTRPDCLGDRVLDVLEELSRRTFLWVEVGIQTASDGLLRSMNRRHTHRDSVRALRSLHGRGIHSSVHVILGYPGESEEDRSATACFVNGSGTLGVKVQNLHVVAGTVLADSFSRGGFQVMTLDEYAVYAVTFLENIGPGVVVQRLTGEAPRELTVAPGWSVNKLAVLDAVKRRMRNGNSWQGKALGYPASALREPLSLPE
jgi:radical SAM protein (TIGR01212 family)